jgi:hypothetical protein
MKQEIKNRPFSFLILCYAIMVFYFSQLIRLFEIAGQGLLDNGNDWRYLWNSVYFTVQVMTSVGYGEYYPQTLFGKLFTILAAATGYVLLALAIVAIGYLSNFTPLERKAYDNVQHDVAQ